MVEEMNLCKKLVEIRKIVPYLQKGNQGHQFKYVSSSDTLAAVKAKMDELDVLLVPAVTHHEVRDHKTKNGGHEYFTILSMNFTWINANNPEDRIIMPWTGQGLDSGEKGVGKALTYAEKYFILKFFNIPTDKDDPDSFQQKNERRKPPAKITDGQVREIRDLIAKTSTNVDKFLAWCNLQLIEDIPADKFKLCVAELNKKIPKQESTP